LKKSYAYLEKCKRLLDKMTLLKTGLFKIYVCEVFNNEEHIKTQAGLAYPASALRLNLFKKMK